MGRFLRNPHELQERALPASTVRLFSLTSQETRCLQWCKEGKINWEISEILSISEKTVEFHLANAMRKLGAPNRISAVVAGIKCGLIPL
nr:helix-turn-helix transcriptional regulator [Bradyrhizobium aeschynomenes]